MPFGTRGFGRGGGLGSPPLSVMRRRRRRLLVGTLALLLLAAPAAVFLLRDEGPPPPCCPPDGSLLRGPRAAPGDELLAAAARSVYLLELRDGDGNRFAVGTAWVLDERHLVASAEAGRLLRRLAADERMVARLPGPAEEALPVASAALHPFADLLAERWPRETAASDAAGHLSLAYDLAVLTLAEGVEADAPLPLGRPEELRPGDGLGAVVWRRDGGAFAQHQDTGALRRIAGLFGQPPLEGPVLLLHDLPLAAATAGAPLLDGEGRVVGVMSGIAFVASGEVRFPMGGTATAIGALDDLAERDAETAAPLLSLPDEALPDEALADEALLAGEPAAVEQHLALAALGRPAEAAATGPALVEERRGVLQAPAPPFAHPVSLQQLTVPAGRYLLLLGGDPLAPAVQLYAEGQPLLSVPPAGGPLGAAVFRLSGESDLAVAVLGREAGAAWRFRLLGWPE